MDIPSILLFAGLLIFAAHFFEWLFNFSKIPNVLLLIIVGVLLGPLFGLLTADFFGEAGALFSVMVLAIMLFVGGTELRLDVIQKSWRGTAVLTILGFFITMVIVGYLIMWFTGTRPLLSFMLAAIISGTSSAIVIPLAERLKVDIRSQAMLLLESAFTDVFSIVITIALLKAYQLGAFSIPSVTFDIGLNFIGAAMLGGVAGVGWSFVLTKVRQMQNSFFSTPAAVLILFGTLETVGLSGPIAALAFGITLGNIPYFKIYLERRHALLYSLLHPVTLSERERSFFSEIVFLLQTFFFVFVGLSITLTSSGALATAVALVAAIFVVRLPIVFWSAPKYLSFFDRSVIAVMIPKGLEAAVLATLVVQSGIAGGAFIQEVSYIVIFLSVLVTSLLIFSLYHTSARERSPELNRRP